MDEEEVKVQVSLRPAGAKAGGGRRGRVGGLHAAWPDQPRDLQREAAKLYGASQVMYTVGYCLSLGALLLALAVLLGLRYAHRPCPEGPWGTGWGVGGPDGR